MKFSPLNLILLLALLATWPAKAAEEPDIVPPTNRPDPTELRERARKNLDQRPRMEREFRERNGVQGTNRSTWEKRREELRKLAPTEREARLKELRRQIQQGGEKFRTLAPEERDAKRSELRTRIDAQIVELKKRRDEGLLNESEKRRIERMEQMSRRLSRPMPPAKSNGSDLPPPRPPASPTP